MTLNIQIDKYLASISYPEITGTQGEQTPIRISDSVYICIPKSDADKATRGDGDGAVGRMSRAMIL